MTFYLLQANGTDLLLVADGAGRILLAGGTPVDHVPLQTKLRDTYLVSQKRLRTGESHDAASGFLWLADGASYLLLVDGTSKLTLSSAFTPYLTKSTPRKKLLSAEVRT